MNKLKMSYILSDQCWVSQKWLAHLPRRFKRMIYISSLFGLILNTENPDRELLNKLNDLISLAKNSRTCEVPILLRKAIWKDLGQHNLNIDAGESIALQDVASRSLTTDNCLAIGTHIAKLVPAWLCYGSVAIMANDVIMLIKQLRNLQGNPKTMFA